MYLYVVVGHRPAVDGEPSNNNQPSVIDLTVSEEKFTKSDIEKLIKNKSPIVVLIDRKDENTEVLNVGIKEEGKKQISTTFCYCPDCKSVMTRGGNIKRHACRGTKRAKPRESIDSFIQNSLTLKETTNLARVIGGFALDAGVSFSLCESQPFQTLAKNIFNLGVVRGQKLTEDAVLPGRKAYKNHAMNVAQKRIDQLKPFVVKAAEEKRMCLALDYGKRIDDYFAVIAHFIVETKDGWKLTAKPIGFINCAAEDKKDHNTVWRQLQEVAAEWGISREMLEELAAVSDEGSNLVKAIRLNFKYGIHCFCHISNTIVEHIFVLYAKTNLSSLHQHQITLAHTLLNTCREIVSHVRNSKRALQYLKAKPREPVKTRWMSNLWVFEDVVDHSEALAKLVLDFPETPIADAVDMVLERKNMSKIKQIIELLKPFEIAITKLEAESVPTIHWVSFYFKQYSSTAEVLKSNTDVFSQALGHALYESLQKKKEFMLTPLHLAATLLFPPSRKMQKFSDGEKKQAVTFIDDMIADSAASDDEISTTADTPGPSKDPTTEFFDDEQTTTESAKEEIAKYQMASFCFDKDDDLLNFWSSHSKDYPRLSSVAKTILSFPASESSAERAFRKLQLLLTDLRTRLGPETVKGCMLGSCLKTII